MRHRSDIASIIKKGDTATFAAVGQDARLASTTNVPLTILDGPSPKPDYNIRMCCQKAES